MSDYDRDNAAGYRGLCFALPIALVKRERNLGIYHATHNPGGCATSTGAAPTSLAECFALPKTGGLLGTTTAHPSGAYADELLPADVVDLRMSAHRPDAARLLRRAWERYRGGSLRRRTSSLAASSVDRAVIAVSPVACPSGVQAESSGYNPATGEIVYPTAYAGSGAVTVGTLVSKLGQAVMQVAGDPAVDGVIDIDLANNVGVELPYFLTTEV